MNKLVFKIKDQTANLLETIGFDSEPIVSTKDNVVLVNIQTDDPAILIGRQGEGIEALQHLLRLIFGKDMSEYNLNIVIDICNYREKKVEHIKKTARDSALQVLTTGIEETLAPMSSFERRAVHMVCANIADVETESVNTDEGRRVVIKPKKTNN